MKKVAINGLGRIGRLSLRYYFQNLSKYIEIIAANDLTSTDELAYLLRFDSVHRQPEFDISYGFDYLEANGKKIQILHEKDPAKLPWKQIGIDIVLECTGLFLKREDAMKHLQAGASKVILSAPSDSADITIVRGANEDKYDSHNHNIISNASCTTNSLAPVIKVLNDTYGIKHLLVTTIHAYTASQALVDKSSKKKRRGRAAAMSLIPTTTGAAIATGLVIPELKDKIDALAIRAPIPDGAISDIVAELKRDVTIENINETLKKAANGQLNKILAYSEDELVSSDIIDNMHSGIIDSLSTRVVDKRLVKVLVWYDNEAGYAKKLLELAEYISRK